MTTTPASGPRPFTVPTAKHRTRFFDYRIPSLYAGRYEIHDRQILKDVDGGDRVIDATPQPFDVIEPRFSIDPGGINARFPAPDAVGTYSQTLPHINLDAPGLPWNRPLGPEYPKPAPPEPGDPHPEPPKAVPWMALLLFREDELPEDPDAVGSVTAGTVRELLCSRLGPGRPPALPSESLREEEYEERCATVLVPADLFDKVKPLPVEMGYFAHVREGGRPDATVAGSDPAPDEKQLNGVVIANRFPAAAGGRHVVHLVSLEGFDQNLTAPAPAEGVRLVSLTSWTFTTEPDSGIGFGDLAQHLATTDGVTPRDTEELRLRLPVTAPADPSAPQREALDRMAGGAVALPQRLETGERTIAFHRGPLTARPARELPPPGPDAVRLESSGEALIYLEKYGVFDTAYGGAFTAGRLLALSDAEFRAGLLEFRSAARSAVRRLASHPQPAGTVVTARQLTAPLAFEAFDHLLLDEDATRFTRAVDRAGPQLRAGLRRTASTSARPPCTAADLRALVGQPGIANLLAQAAGDRLSTVTGWLDRLRRLEMLGFEHLVPDSRMLPEESIRFAYVDPEWVRAAVDGALSVGVGHALDADLNNLATSGGPVPACAVLIRSALVPQWPQAVITAYRGAGVVEPLRSAVYGTDIRLLLYPQVIDRFELCEPPRGICFGIGDVGTIELREISGDRIGYPKGEFPQPAGFSRFLRPGDADVLNAYGDGDALVPALADAHGVEVEEFSSAYFALQMINAPQAQTFSYRP
ncbi:hypothetical protein Spla01_01289 [Streptomyces platensis]|uniref:Uncharacterized protein n=1 Tax=Streptomyces platensis TaxID=58346 RepID=A0ABX3XMK6_STRPT|nr:hypothetical protein [Streptomyces platensis]OSY36796.1 hypothetical protein BG653_06702 [Streptomyces platensis]